MPEFQLIGTVRLKAHEDRVRNPKAKPFASLEHGTPRNVQSSLFHFRSNPSTIVFATLEIIITADNANERRY